MTVTVGSLFSGYGGLDRAVTEVLGGETIWTSDIDPGANKILATRYPNVPNLGDVALIDWQTVPRPRVLTGGFPCQDVSMAGRRAGLTAGTRSGLWAMMARAISELHPDLVVIENVRGLLSADGHADVELCPWCMGNPDSEPVLRALGSVLGDLADIGYDAAWHGLSAASVGAPHARFRVFVIAWPAPDAADDDGDGRAGTRTQGRGARGDDARDAPGVVGERPGELATARGEGQRRGADSGTVRHADVAAGDQRGVAATGETEGGRPRADVGGSGRAPDVTDAEGAERRTAESDDMGAAGQRTAEPRKRASDAPDAGREGLEGRGPVEYEQALAEPRSSGSAAPDALGRGLDGRAHVTVGGQGGRTPARRDSGTAPDAPRVDGQRGQGAIAGIDRLGTTSGEPRGSTEADRGIEWGRYGPAIARWESVLGRPSPSPTEPSRTGAQRLSPVFVEWMMGLPAGWVTAVPGLGRNEQLKALGNGVVPQQAAEALRILLGAVS